MLRLPPKLQDYDLVFLAAPQTPGDIQITPADKASQIGRFETGSQKVQLTNDFLGDFTNKNSGFSAAKICVRCTLNICGSDRI
jgi:hypothetical protein